VFALVITGKPNKQVAAPCGAEEKTFQVHRGPIMRKMRAGSLVERVRMADKVAVPSTSVHPLSYETKVQCPQLPA
jgi:FixJ family two-component response regulator